MIFKKIDNYLEKNNYFLLPIYQNFRFINDFIS